MELKPNRLQKKILKECMLLSSWVYNSTNYIVRQQFFGKEKISNFRDLQVKLQTTDDYKLLGRSYSLPRIQIYSETNSARFKLIESKSQKKVGLPKYLKNRKTNTTLPSYLVIDNSQYSLSKTKATIPLSRAMRKKYSVKSFKIAFNGILKHKGKQQRGQIHFKNNKFYLYQSVDVKDAKLKESKIVAGLDLGIKTLLALTTINNRELLIGSKRFFRQWQYWTNLIAKEQEILSRINRKSSKKLLSLFGKRKKYQDNLFNNVVSKMSKFLVQNNVSRLIVGDVKGIREDNVQSKIGNQMIHNYWSFDILLHKIENKMEESGIAIDKITEEYTSQTCPECFHVDENNNQDRTFLCTQCGFGGHRDLVGSRNILIKGMRDLKQSSHRNETVPFEVS